MKQQIGFKVYRADGKKVSFVSLHERGSKPTLDLTEELKISILNISNIVGLAHERML